MASDWTGANTGLPLRTPHLDRLAERGVRLTTVVASAHCAVARLPGGQQEYERCGVLATSATTPLEQTTSYTLLRGRATTRDGLRQTRPSQGHAGLGSGRAQAPARVGASAAASTRASGTPCAAVPARPRDPYMAHLHQRGLAAAHVDDFARRRNFAATFPTPLPDDAYCDNWIGQNGLTLLRRAPRGKPWHLVVNFTGPHEPMDVTPGMARRWRGIDFPQPRGCRHFDVPTHVAIRQNYAAMIENIDRWTGLFIRELRQRRKLDRTLIMFSSDHGEMLGDHNRWGKSVPWHESVGVPLVAAGPGVEQGVVSDALVSLMDLAATFLDFGGVAAPREMDSRSLRPLLAGRTGNTATLSGLAWAGGAWCGMASSS
ncbi:MAG: sulfatase-like hydrolase/transferase [Bryobacterales bacterium]|nr:sulfatase-like hydrolase/transferase [Bryobacterales bacterium]